MERIDTDIAIIGAGSAGLAAHTAARRHTDRLLLIEGGPWGTTCARVGCMPSKLLIAAAEAAGAVRGAAAFGIAVDGLRVDGEAVMRRVRALRDDFVDGVIASMDARIPASGRLRGTARFLDPHSLQVGDVRVHARRIVIATGSAPHVPEVFDGLGDRLLTSDSVFELPRLPGSVAVVGGGVIGLELGQALHRLGVRVQLLHAGTRLGPKGDPVMEAAATAILRRHVPCALGAEVLGAEPSGDGVRLRWRADGGEQAEDFEYVLVAAGRRPRLSALALEHSGLALDARGVPRFDPATLRCGDSHVFIAGDVDADQPLLHVAAEEGRIAGENAARFPDIRVHRRSVPLAIAFTEPQTAVLGQTPAALAAGSFAVGQVDFANQGRSRVIDRAEGLARLYGDRASGRLLGAQLIGPAVEHLAHLLAWTVQQGLTVDEVLALPFYHPVVEEGLRTALRELQQALGAPPPAPECVECGPGG